MKKGFKDYLEKTGEVGYVTRVVHEVVEVAGLPGVNLSETVVFESGQLGQVSALENEAVEVLVLSKKIVKGGTKVARTGKKLEIGVGEELLGTMIDVLGRPLSGKAKHNERLVNYPVDVLPKGIGDRERISRPLQTGIVLVDLLVPLGLGQRELVMGDRKTGKSQLVMQTVMSQARKGSICVFAAIGKRKTDIMKLQNFLKKENIAQKTVVVAASAYDSAGEIWMTPYTAFTVAEYFRDRGEDVLVVLDDMSTHAQFYRELSLLSRKFPGRDSYPGDIFSIHSRLLERAGNFKVGEREAAITCLPIVESVMGDITGYISTNLMSMTDGHIFFDSDFFFRGRRPAINPFMSVTRVGHQTQTPLLRDIGQVLLELMSNYEKTQSFLKFGAELGENSRQVLVMGNKLLDFFNQPPEAIMNLNVQIILAGLLMAGLWDGTVTGKMVERYDQDAEFRKAADEMVTQCRTLDFMISELRKNPQFWLSEKPI
ncbi:MAG: ATP synthase subunit alpha [Candidatus Amesbacteria bacterium GW2011_GWA2_47_11]|uniref:ATP synthase subunit alpha n=1 Tax=Candidatus Amesbacteria bacterium GW2011_GWA2_47_11 TaxID=1618357 RepID=A0A0G1UDB1_9BACT|nr:MAG: ATP synthase subunit alpha [Candidatus Amesbacteria bacterium GW2011_GWA2_47_11]OGD00261.1 MAG: hypothetical protein A2702_03880 [Candidatus Amesbacteria bacterium RIFCSPHIGHO2_01_FULL_48_75]